MENLIIITESDFKKWVKEAVNECILKTNQAVQENPKALDGLLNREEIAKFLRISLVTLTDWVSEGCHHTNSGAGFILIKKRY